MRFSPRLIIGSTATVFIATLGFTGVARGQQDRVPTSDQIAFATTVSDLMVNEVVAALFQEFNETTTDNVAHGKQAISLIFNDQNRDMRLIGTSAPLLGGDNDLPADRFEKQALRLALQGQAYTDVQKINDTYYYRRSVPLSNTMHQACVLCHTTFTPEFFAATNNPGQWVGALVLAVPIR